MKLTKEQVKEIESLRNNMQQKEIAKKFKVTPSTIWYYFNKEKKIKQTKENFNKKSVKEKREIYKRHNPYFKIWFKNKYHNDPVFRKKHIEKVKLSFKKRKNVN